MPEGPSIVILKEEASKFIGRKVLSADGNTKTIDVEGLVNKKIVDLKSWGKHFLICFKGFTTKVHFLLFGSYAFDTPKDRQPRLHLRFTNGSLFLYACSIRTLEGDPDEHYDWSSDVMNDDWDPIQAKVKVKDLPDAMICDTLLNQNIFAGVGNIIKNEVLYRVGVHPESINGKISGFKLNQIIREARIYSFDFLEWKKQFVLRKHWLAHTKKICVKCKGPITKKYTGENQRRSFYCIRHQRLYE